MALGGRAAENITFNRITTGAQNDLEKVTKIATAQVSKFGMNERIGPMYVPDEAEQNYSGDKPYSKALGNIIDQEVNKVVSDAYKKTEAILIENRDKLTKVRPLQALSLSRHFSNKFIFVYSWPKRYSKEKHSTTMKWWSWLGHRNTTELNEKSIQLSLKTLWKIYRHKAFRFRFSDT